MREQSFSQNRRRNDAASLLCCGVVRKEDLRRKLHSPPRLELAADVSAFNITISRFINITSTQEVHLSLTMSKTLRTSGGSTENGEEPLVDTTAKLPLRSKRTERQQKKRHQKEKASKQHATLWDLPSELLIDILTLLEPSDLLNLTRVNHSLRSFISQESTRICRVIVAYRYGVLSRCFLPPVLLKNVNKEAHPALLSDERQAILNIHKRPYQHIAIPDQTLICTCLTCILAWNNLNLVLDFAFWQKNLNEGEPIAMIPRGKNPKWNRSLVSRNGEVVTRALNDPLCYAAILERHLKSTVGSILRHSKNKGNKRKRFEMSTSDAKSGTDQFLSQKGPATLDFPFHRDNYYMLEAFLPNRGWNSEAGEWKYMPASQHETDVGYVVAWAKRKAEVETTMDNSPESLAKASSSTPSSHNHVPAWSP